MNIDNASSKRTSVSDRMKKPWQREKKSIKNDISSSKINVINVIQDVGLFAFWKRHERPMVMIL